MKPHVLAAAALLLLAAPVHAQNAPATLRDPRLPYSSWSDAQRETAEAIAGRTLARPADGRYRVGDAVIYDDDGKKYRAHVVGIANGRYEVHYDGFGPDWTVRADVDELLGYQPGYAPAPRAGAPAAARAIRPGDEMEAQSRGKWYPARVTGVRGAEYRVHYDGQPRSSDEWVPRSRLRYFAGGPARTAPLAEGKYACNASRYDSGSGTYRYDPKGSVVLTADGRYQYLGFAQPSPGRYRVDAASGVASFTGGHLDGGEATPIVQRPGRFYLTAPRIGERWTCGSTRS